MMKTSTLHVPYLLLNILYRAVVFAGQKAVSGTPFNSDIEKSLQLSPALVRSFTTNYYEGVEPFTGRGESLVERYRFAWGSRSACWGSIR